MHRFPEDHGFSRTEWNEQATFTQARAILNRHQVAPYARINPVFGCWLVHERDTLCDSSLGGFRGSVFVTLYRDGRYLIGNAECSFAFSADGHWIATLGSEVE